jgi:poly-beta-1,6-N-acetyl-D-glucosamine N-deacetylase
MSLAEIVKNLSRIVTFHKVTHSEKLRAQLEYAKRHDVLVTVDDGDPSFYHVFYPEAKRLQIPVVLFVVTSLIDTERPFWWDEIVHHLGSAEGNKRVGWLKTTPNTAREKFLQEMRNNSNKEPLRYKQLTTAQLKEMESNGVIIANHSHTHPMFDQSTEEEIRAEFRASRKCFEEKGLNGYSIFAYPNGNFNEMTERILKEEGVEYAFLFDHKLNRLPINPMRISRLSVNDDTPLWKFKLILSGWHSRLAPVTKGIHKLLS